MATERTADVKRDTAETRIELRLNLDGRGESAIRTGIPFFDHMLVLWAKHGLFDLEVKAEGDVEVDYHHTVEDVGIVLGQAFKNALGDKTGIRRYGFSILPMDECLARISIDLGNRPFFVYDVTVRNYFVRDFNIALVKEFMQAFAAQAGANLHVRLEYGDEPHHIAECLFKCFARALDEASVVDLRREGQVPSTKGTL